MNKHLLFIMLLISQVAFSQVSDLLVSSMAIANTSTARTDTWTAFHNPASLVQASGWQVAAQYENHYLTAELSTAMVQAAYCNRYLNVGFGYSFFGYDEWNEMMATVSFSRRFGRFSLGLAADLVAVYAGRERGYCLTAVPQIGVTVDATDTWTIGFETFNPFIQQLPDAANSRSLPAVYRLGSDWRFRHDMRWDVEVSYDVNSTFCVATGYEWRAIEQLTAKVGVYYKQYFVACLGLAVHLGHFTLDLDAELHPVLGLCPQTRLAVSY